MPNLAVMTRAARRALTTVLELTADDRVLVVGDASAGACPDAFLAAARAEGCHADLVMLPEKRRPLREVPAELARLLDRRDVVVNAVSGRSDEVPFRIAWIKEVEDRGLRLGHSPGIVDAMLEGGAVDVDYAVMRAAAEDLVARFRDAVSVRITAPAGTDLTLGLAGRPFVSDTHITATEKGVNLPCGEAYACPVETEGGGVLVVDGCFGMEGDVSAPVAITVRDGRATDVACDDPALAARVVELLDTDDGARAVCELGIGLNPNARLQGNMLEDEKALRTCHVAFGGNQGMPGGSNASSMHMDYLVHRPSMTVTYADGSTADVLRDGDIVPSATS